MYILKDSGGNSLEIQPDGPEGVAYVGVYDMDRDDTFSMAVPQGEAVKAASALLKSAGFKALSGLRGTGPKEVFANNALVALEGLSTVFTEEERVAAEVLAGLDLVAEEFFTCKFEELDGAGARKIVRHLYEEREKNNL